MQLTKFLFFGEAKFAAVKVCVAIESCLCRTYSGETSSDSYTTDKACKEKRLLQKCFGVDRALDLRKLSTRTSIYSR